ncbi:hypothetical protein LEMA_P120320.1 [Plenodomus lingam JN3]|uniref:ATP-dependent DNA helicase n=1 Tax=Leptosphaeria maculans (strain JN3 / isolate v23.1.3 / race Av1-4-5-6-7-8) TaxID=985895 RepID=E4ZSV3_LEPMJ|nr:hypothetical protein LEMA_P120320.1 [Plenodomus lingam JN3]CBX94541.1 hypothetical protein LEMA_P120320.1 [Plenodomus lingam JN3]
MSAPRSDRVLGIRPKKRRFEGTEDDYSHIRRGPNGTPTAADSRTRQTTSPYDLPQGTQYNPVELESSPEPEPEATKSRRTIATTSPVQPSHTGHRSAGLVMQKVDSSVRKPKYYAVAGGHAPGVYTEWTDVERQIKGFSGAKQQKFSTEAQALEYLDQHRSLVQTSLNRQNAYREPPPIAPATCLEPTWGTSYSYPAPSFQPPQFPHSTSHLVQYQTGLNTEYTYPAPSFQPPQFPHSTSHLVQYQTGLNTEYTYPAPGLPPSQIFQSTSHLVPNQTGMDAEYIYPAPALPPSQIPHFKSQLLPYQHGMNTDYTSTSTHLQPLQALNPASLPAPPGQNPEPDHELTLSPEQQQVVDLILQGHNVFYTGSAGCGKSTILKAFVKKMEVQHKRVKIVAPTNLAALNVNGQTTWNYAGWTPDSMKKPLDKLMQAAHGKEVWERFNSTDVLVLDEVSMVENLMFERLNQIMKASIGEMKGGGAFGGVQFCQLAPVKPFKHCIGCGWELIPDNKFAPKEHRCENRRCNRDVFYDIDKWAFRSDAWQECNFKHINLTEIHRQHDKMFISILQRIRTDGVILPNHARVLLNHTSETKDAIKLFSTRDDVDRTNNENINKLAAAPHRYKCVDHFEWREHHRDDKSLQKNTRLAEDDNGTLHALKEHRYEVFVQLKEGMRVVLQANLEPSAGLVNGSQGSIIGFELYDPLKLPRKAENRDAGAKLPTAPLRGIHAKYSEHQIKAFVAVNKNQPWPIVKFDNGLTRTIYADCTANELGNDEPYSLLSRTQIPLMAGYAITVHKSQGMTLDRVIVDLGRAFEPSQIYVALSRARSLKGLKVVALPQRNLGGANAQVKEFFAKYLSKK